MDPQLRISIVIFFLLFVELYPARVNSLRIISADIVKPSTEVSFEMKGRLLMKVDTDDYKEYDSNHKNDQGKGKPHG
ncbi:transmembrane protein, putative [Medicago truncatula]|nr:transmembrane protein, putative [Medicago truncatula]